MTDGSIRITRRRVLGSLATVGGASAATGAGTMAYLTDTESSSGNAVHAGTLDLQLDGADQQVTFLDADNIQPTDSGNESVLLGNTGSLEGTVEIDIDAIRDYENGILKKEEQEGDTTTDQGELQKYLDVRIEIDGAEILGWTAVENLSPGTYQTSQTIAPGNDAIFTVYWRFEDDSGKTINESQSDSVELDITFRLVQSGGG